MILGAGRKKITDIIDHSVGVVLHKKVGDKVNINDSIATIYSNYSNVDEVKKLILDAFSYSNEPITPQIILKVIK